MSLIVARELRSHYRDATCRRLALSWLAALLLFGRLFRVVKHQLFALVAVWPRALGAPVGPGGRGDALEALTSRSDSGQLLFTAAPFGDSTVWSSRASGGTMRFACLFDPRLRWRECAQLSSTVGSDA